MSGNLNLSLLLPEKVLFQGEITELVIQGSEGSLGILPGHAPLITQLGIGELKFHQQDTVSVYVVEGGFMEVSRNKINVLAENAIPKSELDQAAIEAKIAELDSIKSADMDSIAKKSWEKEVLIYQTRLKIAKEK